MQHQFLKLKAVGSNFSLERAVFWQERAKIPFSALFTPTIPLQSALSAVLY
jgi:hypothetical protein